MYKEHITPKGKHKVAFHQKCSRRDKDNNKVNDVVSISGIINLFLENENKLGNNVNKYKTNISFKNQILLFEIDKENRLTIESNNDW